MSDQTSGLPSFRDVYGELVKLRNNGGLARHVIIKHATNLLSLPVVSSELERRRLAADSRPEALVAVIGCAAERAIPDYESQIYLRHTLIECKPNSKMEARLRSAAEYLEQYGISASSMKDANDKAYNQLASKLLILEFSPCSIDVRRRLSKLLEQRAEVDSEIAHIVRTLGRSELSVLQGLAADALRLRLPRGFEKAEQHSLDGMSFSRAILAAAICHALDRVSTDHDLVLSLLFQEYLSILDEWHLLQLRGVVVGDNVDEILRPRSRDAAVDNMSVIELAMLRAKSVRLLSAAMEEEERENWPSLADPNASVQGDIY